MIILKPSNIIYNWLIYAIAVMISAYLLPGAAVDNLPAALVTAVVLGLVNIFLKPILIVLTLPITIVTLGFFALIVNAFLVLLVAEIVPGFRVAGLWWAFLFSVVMTLVNWMLNRFEAGRVK